MSPRGVPAHYHAAPIAPTAEERMAVLRALVLTGDRERAARIAGVRYDTAARVAAGSGWPDRERVLEAYVRDRARTAATHVVAAVTEQRELDAVKPDPVAVPPRVTVDQVLRAAERSTNLRKRTLASIARHALSELVAPASTPAPTRTVVTTEYDVPEPDARPMLPPARDIRAWAIANGIPCLANGQLRADVIDAWREAHPEGYDPADVDGARA